MKLNTILIVLSLICGGVARYFYHYFSSINLYVHTNTNIIIMDWIIFVYVICVFFIIVINLIVNREERNDKYLAH